MSIDISSGKRAYSGKSAYEGPFSTSSNTPSSYSSSSGSAYKQSGYTSSYQPRSTYTSSTSKKSEGCYIATMAYGDYNHPQVMVLRRFRDEKLLPTVAGRLFVKFYYLISPKLVSVLSGHERINRAIRYILDSFVDYLNRRA